MLRILASRGIQRSLPKAYGGGVVVSSMSKLSAAASFHTTPLRLSGKELYDKEPGLMSLFNWIFFKEISKAMWLMMIYMLRQDMVTIHYPYERNTKSSRTRGEHALMIYPDGDERCIACQLCEVTCPAQCISIDGVEDDDGRRMAARFDLDMHKCIYCGLCQEACPVDAIVQTPNYEFACTVYDALLYDKAKLLENGIRWTSAIEYQIMKERTDYPVNSRKFKVQKNLIELPLCGLLES